MRHHIQLVTQLYGLPHGILGVLNTILYKNEFQNPQIFQQNISLFPEQSTLCGVPQHFLQFFDGTSGFLPSNLLYQKCKKKRKL
jgi:hypothetical protein